MGNLGNMGNMVATIGFFDGLHEGHRYVLSQLMKLAEERGGGSVVFTFKNHPASLFAPDRVPPMLLTASEKEERLLAMGIGKVVMLDFNKELASLSAADFLGMMAEEYGVRTLLLGYDNHFGKKELDANGVVVERSFEDYVALGKAKGVEVKRLGECPDGRFEDSAPTSSTLIRSLLLEGRLSEAAARLGYRYSVEGKVVAGKRIGREMGFPTANVEPSPQKLVPKTGVYAAIVNGKRAVVNIGCRPTFDGETPTIEAHIIDFAGDLYGQTIRIEFVERLRDEKRFPSRAQLAGQIQKDKSETEKIIVRP